MASGVAEGVGTEFKTQCCKKEQNWSEKISSEQADR
jgi:hypothetical protein